MAAAASSTASFTLTRLLSSQKSFSLSTRTSFLPHKTSSSFSLNLRSNLKPFKFSTSAASSTKISAVISVGDTLPEATFSYFDPEGELKTTTVSDLTKGKKAVIFAVPGAFTPTCSLKHVPGFADLSGELKSKGVDTIACISVNDAFVMKAWKADVKTVYPGVDDVLLLSDGNANFTKAIGCELDLTDNPVGLGIRSRRYSMLVEDGVVKVLNLEEGGAFTSSSAEDILAVL